MAKTTMLVGFILIAVGIAFWGATGRVAPTSLIPCYFGIVLMICGAMARTEDHRRRMIFMHIAVTVAVIGFLFPGLRGSRALAAQRAAGIGALTASKAIEEQLLMAFICLVFSILCIRSFILARRNRTAPPVEA